MIHEDGASAEEAEAYLERWARDARAGAHSVRFVIDPTWRAYVINYSAGRELVPGWVGGDPARFGAADRARAGRRSAAPVGRPAVAGATEQRERPLHRRRGRRAGLRRDPRAASSRRPASRSRARALAGEADVDRAVEAARAALDGAWGKTPATERSRLLHALADAIVANRAELTELESRNVGKAISSVEGRALRRGRELPLLRLRDRDDRRAARTRSAARSSSTR